MQKIPTLFARDPRFKVFDQVTEGCEWVFRGEGIATEKMDGTNVRVTIRGGLVVRVEKRRNPSREQKKVGIIDGWYVDATDGPEDKWILEGVRNLNETMPDGEHCCEVLGPKINGNPLGLSSHTCEPFDLTAPVVEPSRSFEGLRAFLADMDSRISPGHLAEGIVFHHLDGRRAKIKRKDFDYTAKVGRYSGEPSFIQPWDM